MGYNYNRINDNFKYAIYVLSYLYCYFVVDDHHQLCYKVIFNGKCSLQIDNTKLWVVFNCFKT